VFGLELFLAGIDCSQTIHFDNMRTSDGIQTVKRLPQFVELACVVFTVPFLIPKIDYLTHK